MEGFDLKALYTALDEQRRARGLSWAAATREINALSAGLPSRRIATSTVMGLATKERVEADGVLQMLLWLDRTPESFMPGRGGAAGPEERLPRVGPTRILRFDVTAIYEALNARRRERGLSWPEVAAELRITNTRSLKRMARGGRTSFPHVMDLCAWLGQPAAAFTRAAME